MPATERATRPPLWVGAAALLGLANVDPSPGAPSLCPSAVVFGVACPLCGLTRSISRLVRGDLAASIGFHPMGWIVLAVGAAAWVAWWGRSAGWWTWRSRRIERFALAATGAGLVVSWAARLALGTLPPV